MKVLKFGSIGCVGCIVMKPRWAEIEKENPWLATEFIDADENPAKVREWHVEDLPEFIFLDKNGVEIERLMGEVEKEILVKKINELQER
ncbi:thioredoxin family protein [Patescibacteria group bacterium]|nr:thioredoxin family protein [Patescibacteria group bacterium]